MYISSDKISRFTEWRRSIHTQRGPLAIHIGLKEHLSVVSRYCLFIMLANAARRTCEPQRIEQNWKLHLCQMDDANLAVQRMTEKNQKWKGTIRLWLILDDFVRTISDAHYQTWQYSPVGIPLYIFTVDIIWYDRSQ